MIILPQHYIDLLLKCLQAHKPALMWVIESKEQIVIDEKLGNELRDAVGDELIVNGIENDIPNKYGLELEDLIDVIGRQFIHKN